MKRKDLIYIFLICLFLSSFSLLPFLNNYLHSGIDTIYHISRIEGLARSFQDGFIIPRFYPYKVNGYGYINPVFYSDISLFIPAILYNLKVPIVICYKIMVFIITLLTSLSMAFLIKKFNKSMWAITFGVMLYIFSQYRLTDIYNRGALGELFGFVFYPLIILSVYEIMVESKNNYCLLVLAFSGLLLTHNISFFMGVLFIIILLISLIKYINKDKIFILIKSAFITLGITAFYLLPLLEMTSTQNFIFKNSLIRKDELLSAARSLQIIIWYTFDGFHTQITKCSIGIVLFVLSFFVIFKKQENQYFKIVFWIGILFVYMSTNLFPWQYFDFMATIQFPWRLLTIATCCLSFSCTLMLFEVKNCIWAKIMLVFASVVSLIYIIQINDFSFGYNDDMQYEDIIAINPGFYCDEEDTLQCYQSVWEMGQGNYLNMVNFARVKWDKILMDEYNNIVSDKVFKEKYKTVYILENKFNKVTLVFPVLFYKGIKAELITESGSFRLDPYMDIGNGQVRVYIEKAYENDKIIIWYGGTKIQSISITVSISTILLISFIKGIKFYSAFKFKKSSLLN